MLQRFWTLAARTATVVGAVAAARLRKAAPAEIQHSLHRQPAPLSRDDRWERATHVVSTAVAGFARIESLHTAALSRLDAADYALQHLLEELSTAMPILSADGSALRALLATVEEPEVVAEQGTLAA
jgi:hypothetical protein